MTQLNNVRLSKH